MNINSLGGTVSKGEPTNREVKGGWRGGGLRQPLGTSFLAKNSRRSLEGG